MSEDRRHPILKSIGRLAAAFCVAFLALLVSITVIAKVNGALNPSNLQLSVMFAASAVATFVFLSVLGWYRPAARLAISVCAAILVLVFAGGLIVLAVMLFWKGG